MDQSRTFNSGPGAIIVDGPLGVGGTLRIGRDVRIRCSNPEDSANPGYLTPYHPPDEAQTDAETVGAS